MTQTEATTTTAEADDSLEEAHLLARLRETQDVEAYFRLFERHVGTLFEFAVRQLGGVNQAESALEETFVRLFKLLRHTPPRTAFATVALGVMAQICSARETPPGESALTRGGALGSLLPAQRQVFILHVFHKQSYAAIAETLELPVGTVRTRMSAALGRLQLPELEQSAAPPSPCGSAATPGQEA